MQTTSKRVREDTAIEMLIAGVTVTKTAQAVGVSRRTIERWLGDSGFVARLNGRRAAVWGAIHDRVRGLLAEALDVYSSKLEAGSFVAARDVIRQWGDAVAVGLADIGPNLSDAVDSPDGALPEIRLLRKQISDLGGLSRPEENSDE